MPEKPKKDRLLFIKVLASVLILIVLIFAGIAAAVEIWPSFGAGAANRMRNIAGPRAVARIETVVFQIQDRVKQWQYQSGVEQAEAPWASDATPPEPDSRRPVSTLTSTSENPSPTPSPTSAAATEKAPDQRPTQTASPSPTPTPYVWQLSALTPFGSLADEGLWQPYLSNQAGEMVAARTFLQPDPERPYAIVAVVAFDLNRTALHFVLGFNEPALPDGPTGDGLIPEEDRRAGVLLAAFNGGFRAANGHFGAMANGVVALPPKDEFATVGIYRNGEVKIGVWGEDIFDTPDLQAWRQNCRLIIQEGEISPRVYNDSITDWGASISNQIVTRRSGMGLDREAKTLYYFAGPSLSMPALADAMLVAGVHQGMLLDINNFWVHFTAIRAENGALVAEPLLPDHMIDKIDRYLGPSPADFFYVTALDDDLEP